MLPALIPADLQLGFYLLGLEQILLALEVEGVVLPFKGVEFVGIIILDHLIPELLQLADLLLLHFDLDTSLTHHISELLVISFQLLQLLVLVLGTGGRGVAVLAYLVKGFLAILHVLV